MISNSAMSFNDLTSASHLAESSSLLAAARSVHSSGNSVMSRISHQLSMITQPIRSCFSCFKSSSELMRSPSSDATIERLPEVELANLSPPTFNPLEKNRLMTKIYYDQSLLEDELALLQTMPFDHHDKNVLTELSSRVKESSRTLHDSNLRSKGSIEKRMDEYNSLLLVLGKKQCELIDTEYAASALMDMKTTDLS